MLGRVAIDVFDRAVDPALCSEAWVLTDESNTAARAAYWAAGGDATTGVVMAIFPFD